MLLPPQTIICDSKTATSENSEEYCTVGEAIIESWVVGLVEKAHSVIGDVEGEASHKKQ